MFYRIVIFASLLFLFACSESTINQPEDSSELLFEREGNFTGQAGKVNRAVERFYNGGAELSEDELERNQQLQEAYKDRKAQQKGVDPIDDVCIYFTGPTAAGEDVDCVKYVSYGLDFAMDGNCLDDEPCAIFGTIYGRSVRGAECDWEVHGLIDSFEHTGTGFYYDFDAFIDCGDWEEIKVYANDKLVKEILVECIDCPIFWPIGF